MNLIATDLIDQPEDKEPGMNEIDEAITKALKELGFDEISSGGSIFNLETMYVYDATGKLWIISIREQELHGRKIYP